MLLIGSGALNRIKFTRKPTDMDFIGTMEEIKAFVENLKITREILQYYPIDNGKKIFVQTSPASLAKASPTIFEFEIAYPGSLAEEFLELHKRIKRRAIPVTKTLYDFANLNFLYALKMSHRYLKNSPHFLKTMEDIHIMRKLGAYLPDAETNLYKWYLKRIEATYDYAHPSLNQSKDDFFSGDGVNYVYDHDSLHEAVAQGMHPAYTYYSKPGGEVECSEEAFQAQGQHVRLNGVLEEAYVLALERSQIPNGLDVVPRKKSFDIALMKICTSITSGWFREFAWENYYSVQELYNDDYVDLFKQGLDNGTVKSHGI